ncbi:hypothetical protein ACFE04_004050 [Oxalis oulophora]
MPSGAFAAFHPSHMWLPSAFDGNANFQSCWRSQYSLASYGPYEIVCKVKGEKFAEECKTNGETKKNTRADRELLGHGRLIDCCGDWWCGVNLISVMEFFGKYAKHASVFRRVLFSRFFALYQFGPDDLLVVVSLYEDETAVVDKLFSGSNLQGKRLFAKDEKTTDDVGVGEGIRKKKLGNRGASHSTAGLCVTEKFHRLSLAVLILHNSRPSFRKSANFILSVDEDEDVDGDDGDINIRLMFSEKKMKKKKIGKIYFGRGPSLRASTTIRRCVCCAFPPPFASP